MSFQELFKNKDRFDSIMNYLECPLIYLSETIINDANEMALKVIQLSFQTYIGCCLEEHCKKNKFALAELIDEKSKEGLHIKETYFVNQQPYTIVWKKIVLLDANNRKGFLLVGKNITEEHLAVEKFENAVHFYENTLSKLPTNVYWKNQNSVYIGCNDRLAQVMGLPSRHAIKGMTDFDFDWGEGAAENFIAFDKKVMETGNALTTEDTFQEANGNVVTVLTTKTPLKDKKGETLGVLAISVDITERKKMEEELVQAKKAAEVANYLITEFVSNMGHDLATPISDVGGIAQLLLNYVDEYPELKEDFEILATRSEDCEKVRKRILNATSISNLEIKSEKFSISLVLLALEKELRPTIGSKNLKIIIHPLKPKKEDFIVTDPIKFHDILFDLMSNGIKFTEEGQVTVSVIKKGNLFHIKVSDTGIGIPSDKFDYIFQQYTKLSRSNKYGATFKGVGAGLYLAKIRANILNATLSVESEVGKGSTFTLSIPAVHSNKEDQC
jgi:two-component system, OmpR family, aerobic respiration control sensor histidine kinase ArcB